MTEINGEVLPYTIDIRHLIPQQLYDAPLKIGLPKIQELARGESHHSTRMLVFLR